ncbi:50S ribosomal protein L24 [Candidatus Jorgensenbacteria bacterium CG10_big_fil_rev_8_21_14_0_10_54_38]|uniref:Large ribosomal subunit protein uL24 n=2 Tax=Candidatus Joergenseniibacteriota TaxID=1752739 RepID=A0A2M6WGA2_9BACT|nr:MAG: 50S ribosomal protein L24 [Candidatus Jorgensenbacteria bacterium CG23_combo_of_CG06-09_8_20_14_all_54_14]PIT91833.1 MAG: 50S ribosomal protein L24 [Candidatus Jorgensenbacteria bacterium CG10_big_fil_rev_8_21_14_0_10_54_38]
MRIKKGDTVKILKGKDRGKSGKVIQVNPNSGRAAVEGLNLVKKHVRPRRQGEKGEMVQVPRSIPAANMALVCPHCGAATRIGVRTEESQRRVRYCKKCRAAI